MAGAKMKELIHVGPNRCPWFGLYWANSTFEVPGLYIWVRNQHWRIRWPIVERRWLDA